MKISCLTFSFMLACTGLFAQVAVSKEPHHHVVFENTKVRVLNVLVAPGDTTMYHIHSTPSVFVMLSKTRTGSQRLHQQPDAGGVSTPGYTWFENLAPPNIKVHRVWNADTGMYHVMDVELLQTTPGFAQKPLALPGVKLVVDTPWARIYTTTLTAHGQLAINKRQSNFVLVAVDAAAVHISKNGSGEDKKLEPGSFFWIEKGEQFIVINNDTVSERFVLFEAR